MDFEYTNSSRQFKQPRGCFHAQHKALFLCCVTGFDHWFDFRVLTLPAHLLPALPGCTAWRFPQVWEIFLAQKGMIEG